MSHNRSHTIPIINKVISNFINLYILEQNESNISNQLKISNLSSFKIFHATTAELMPALITCKMHTATLRQ